MTSSHRSSRIGFHLAQVGRFTFALIVGALFGVAAWESPARETHGATAWPVFEQETRGTIAFRPNPMFANHSAPADGPNSAILPIGEAAANKSHKKQQAAAAMPLRWSINDESIPSLAATTQDGEIALRTADLHLRGPPARLTNRSADAQRTDQPSERSGD